MRTTTQTSAAIHAVGRVDIRPAGLDDIDRIGQLMHALEAETGLKDLTLSREALIDLLLAASPWMRLLVATLGDEVIGYVALTADTGLTLHRRRLDIWHVYVTPELRDRGFGRQLINAGLEALRDLFEKEPDCVLRVCGQKHAMPRLRKSKAASGSVSNSKSAPKRKVA